MPRNYEVFPVVQRPYTTTRGRNALRVEPHPPLPLCVRVPARARARVCSVSAVYGDRRRHLPSSLALLLRPASLRYERRDFLPDEDTISDIPVRAFPPSPPFPSRPDLGLMYKNKLVRRATHATVLVHRRAARMYVRDGVTMNSNVSRISIDFLSTESLRSVDRSYISILYVRERE